MYNISQIITNDLLNSVFSNFYSYISNLANPFDLRYSVFNYAHMVETLNDAIYNFALLLLKDAIEKIDSDWRNRPDRVSRYYVKQTRSRTIITLFGVLTYTRTIYIDRHTNESYCHVDSLLGLSAGIKYDPCVRAKAAELYSYHNSMLKVGRILGEQIFCRFSTSKDGNDYAIPRQTIQSFILDFNFISTSFHKMKNTPNILYIMADEKWIPLQERNSEGKPTKLMSRAVIIFEDCINEYKSSNLGLKQRHKLIGKTRVFGSDNDIWLKVEDALMQLYDLDNVKHIHLMGDGASWIKSGVDALSNATYSTDFTLDAFHLNQALLRITNDNEERDALRNSIYELKSRSVFKNACTALRELYPEREQTIESNMNYILNNWVPIMSRIERVSMPCAMESSICHDICNTFTSVPKAYKSKSLRIYLQNRMHYLNGTSMIPLFLHAYDKKKEDDSDIDLSDSYHYSSASSSSSYQQLDFVKNFGSRSNIFNSY